MNFAMQAVYYNTWPGFCNTNCLYIALPDQDFAILAVFCHTNCILPFLAGILQGKLYIAIPGQEFAIPTVFCSTSCILQYLARILQNQLLDYLARILQFKNTVLLYNVQYT